MDYLIISAGLIALLVPVVRSCVDSKTARLNRWGVLFILAAGITAWGAVRQVRSSRQDAQEATERNHALLQKMEHEAQRLSPQDFTVTLFVSQRLRPGWKPIPELPPASAFVEIGDIRISGKLICIAPSHNFGGGRGGSFMGFDWYLAYFVVDGLQQLPYLSDLSEKHLTIHVPLDNVRPPSESDWTYTVAVSVKGRTLARGELNDTGRFSANAPKF